MAHSQRMALDSPLIVPFSLVFYSTVTLHKRNCSATERVGCSGGGGWVTILAEMERRDQIEGDERAAHNARQAALFDQAADFFVRPIPVEVEQRTARIVAAADLPPGFAALDVGTGVGVLIPYLRAAGAARILACDLSETMLAHARARHGDAAEFLRSDIIDLPAERGPFDAIVFNAMFGNVHDPIDTLRAARRLLVPSGRVVISHPMGREWHRHLRTQYPNMVLRDLPDAVAAPRLLADAGLRLLSMEDAPDLYILVAAATQTEGPPC
jgi:SAM-dependent methyltransferase